MGFITIKPNPNDAVLESYSLTSLCVSPNDHNINDYSISVSNISQVVEAFVLYDRVLVVRYPKYIGSGPLVTKVTNTYALDSLILTMQSEGILEFIVLDEEPEQNHIRMLPLSAQLNSFGLSERTMVNTKVNKEICEYSSLQQEVARRLHCAFLPSSQSFLTESFTKANILQRINIAQKLLNVLDTATRADVDSLKNIGVPVMVYIPPFLAIVLEKVTRGADFGIAVLEVRQKFTSLRTLVAEYETVLKDTSQPLKKLLQARTKIFSDIERVSKTLGQETKVGFLEWADVLDSIPESVTAFTTGTIPQSSLVRKLVELPISKLREILLKRRYAALFSTYRDFQQIKNYSKLVNTSFEHFENEWKIRSGDEYGIFMY